MLRAEVSLNYEVKEKTAGGCRDGGDIDAKMSRDQQVGAGSSENNSFWSLAI